MTLTYPWHQPTWQYFKDLHRQQRIPHAILLQGIHGLGKFAFAEKLVASLLCLNLSADAESCGQCHSCELLRAGSHPDHLVVKPEDAGKAIKVDQIRELKEKQTLMSKVSIAKVVLISPADAMNINAFNSLLKLLEEPQQNTVFILITEKPQRLPITIRSRCQVIKLATPQHDDAMNWLADTLPELDVEARQKLLNIAHGAPLLAAALSQDGLQHYQQIQQDMAAIMRANANPIQMAASWQQFDLIAVMHQLQTMVQTKLRQLMTKDNRDNQPQVLAYWAISDCITDTIKLLSSANNLNKTLLTEALIVKLMQHAKQARPTQITSR